MILEYEFMRQERHGCGCIASEVFDSGYVLWSVWQGFDGETVSVLSGSASQLLTVPISTRRLIKRMRVR